jgi:hypothetical protein
LFTPVVTLIAAFGGIYIERRSSARQADRQFLRDERLRAYFQFEEVIARFAVVTIIGMKPGLDYAQRESFSVWLTDLQGSAARMKLIAPDDVAELARAVCRSASEMARGPMYQTHFNEVFHVFRGYRAGEESAFLASAEAWRRAARTSLGVDSKDNERPLEVLPTRKPSATPR